MKALRFVLVIGVLAAAVGCSRREAAEKSGPSNTYTAAQTYQYIQDVGRIRALFNADNRGRIPALIRGQDVTMLGDQASRMEQYRQNLAKLATEGVDPEAAEFAQHFGSILDAYKAMCSDTAELFREAIQDDAAKPGSNPLMPAIKRGLLIVQTDTIGAVGSLIGTMDQLDTTAKAHAAFLSPMVKKLRDDLGRLVDARERHHSFAQKVKSDFAERYPKYDWASKDVLP